MVPEPASRVATRLDGSPSPPAGRVRDPRQLSLRARGQSGFTLVEVLIAVAIIALLASIAIPALQNARIKSKRNAVVSELRVLRDAFRAYSADRGYYPLWGTLNYATLDALRPTYIKTAAPLEGLIGRRLDFYIPWNYFEEDFPSDFWASPQSFVFYGRLTCKPSLYIIVSDQDMNYLDSTTGDWTPVGAN